MSATAKRLCLSCPLHPIHILLMCVRRYTFTLQCLRFFFLSPRCINVPASVHRPIHSRVSGPSYIMFMYPGPAEEHVKFFACFFSALYTKTKTHRDRTPPAGHRRSHAGLTKANRASEAVDKFKQRPGRHTERGWIDRVKGMRGTVSY